MNVTNRNLPPLVGYDKGTVANRDFQGSLDDLRIYRNALNASEIRSLYWRGDQTKPVTQAAVDPAEPNGKNGWYTSDVSVTLSVYDDLSGAAKTEYRLNGGAWVAFTGRFNVSVEGTNVLEYHSIDQAGNVEDPRMLILKIDKTAPRLSIVPDRTELWPPNHKWVPIRMSIDAKDDASGISTIELVSITSNELNGEPASQIREAEFGTPDTNFLLKSERNGDGSGRTYTIVYKATDKSGQFTTGMATVSVAHDQSKD